MENITKQDTTHTTAFYKVNDFYAKHNLGTRLSLIAFIGVYIYVVVYSPIAIELINTTGWLALFAFIVITLGDNAVSKFGDILIKLKGLK